MADEETLPTSIPEDETPVAAAAPAPAASTTEDPAETKLVDDAESDFKSIHADALDDLEDLIEDATGAADKLLTAAAGDVTPLLTDAEAAAIPFLASHAGMFGSAVSQYGSLVVGAVGAPLNAEVSKEVKIGLAHALASLQAITPKEGEAVPLYGAAK